MRSFEVAVAALDITVIQVNILVVDSFNMVTKVATAHAEVRTF